MALTSADIEMIRAIISHMMRAQHVPVAEHGVAYGGSWSPVDGPKPDIEAGTVQVTSGKTAAILGDDGDQGIARPRINVASTAIGDQYGPRGGERTVLVPTDTGPIALFIHGSDDTNAFVLPGERIIWHRNANGTLDAHIHLSNDGKTVGDGLGGVIVNGGTYFKLFTTNKFPATAPAIVADDASGTVQLANASVVIADAVVRQSDLVALLASIQTQLDTWAAAHLQSGTGATGPTTLTTIVPTASAKTYTA